MPLINLHNFVSLLHQYASEQLVEHATVQGDAGQARWGLAQLLQYSSALVERLSDGAGIWPVDGEEALAVEHAENAIILDVSGC
jgi:hypothetical protein